MTTAASALLSMCRPAWPLVTLVPAEGTTLAALLREFASMMACEQAPSMVNANRIKQSRTAREYASLQRV
jgi:hypothetical protein